MNLFKQIFGATLASILALSFSPGTAQAVSGFSVPVTQNSAETEQVTPDRPLPETVYEPITNIDLTVEQVSEETFNVKATPNVDVFSPEFPIVIKNAKNHEILTTCLDATNCQINVNKNEVNSIVAQSNMVMSEPAILEETQQRQLLSTQTENSYIYNIVLGWVGLNADEPNKIQKTMEYAYPQAKTITPALNSHHGFYVFDMNTGISRLCSNPLTTCLSEKNRDEGVKTYKAYIIDENTNPYSANITLDQLSELDILGESNEITLERAPFNIEISLMDAEYGRYESMDGYAQTSEIGNGQEDDSDYWTPYKYITHNSVTNEYVNGPVYFDIPYVPTIITGYAAKPIFDPNNPTKIIGVTDIQASVTRVLGQSLNTGAQTVIGKTNSGGSNPSEDCVQACAADPVNTYSGEYWENIVDIPNISSTGTMLSFIRSYSSLNSDKNLSGLGYGWTHNYDMKIVGLNMDMSTFNGALKDAPYVSVKQENGSQSLFTKTNGGAYVTFLNTHAKLSYNQTSNNFTFIRDNTYKFSFSSTGLLTQTGSTKTTNVLNFTYVNTQLTKIEDNYGQKINITWLNGKIVNVSALGAGTITYTYTANDLTTVKDGSNENWNYQYTTTHLLKKKINPKGAVVENVYNTGIHAKTVASQKDALNRVTTFVPAVKATDSTALITNPDGSTIKQKYDTFGKITQLEKTDSNDNIQTWKYVYDTETGYLMRTEDPEGGQTDKTYNAAGNVITSTNELNQTTSYEYDENQNATKIITPLGKETTFEYDATGKIIHESTPAGKITSYTYDTTGRPLTVTEGIATVTYYYDIKGFVNKISGPLGDNILTTVNSTGLPLTVIDAKNKTTSYTYNLRGQKLTSKTPTGAETSYQYDAVGNLTKTIYPDLTETSYQYDLANNVTQTTNPLGEITVTEYDSNNNINKVIHPDTSFTLYSYNSYGILEETTDPAGKKTVFQNDWRGNVYQQTTPGNKTTYYTYDLAGQLTQQKLPDNNVTNYVYDDDGKLTTSTDALNHTTTYEYTDDNEVSKLIRPDNKQSNYVYDERGNLTQYVDEANNTANYTYNLNDQLVTSSEKGINETYEYDANGKLTKRTNTDSGTFSQHTYNALNQVTQISYSDSTPTISYTYDNEGVIQTMVDGNGTTQYQYDNLDRVTKKLSSTQGNIEYTYDNAGNIKTLKYPSGKTVTYTYDLNNNITNISEPTLGNIGYTYNDDNYVTEETFPGNVKSTYSYVADDYVSSIVTKKGTTTLSNQTYTYGLSGLMKQQKIVGQNIATQTENYTYDQIDRIKNHTESTTTTSYGFDDISNTVNKKNGDTLTYNNKNQIINMVTASTSSPDYGYTYDNNGNRTAKTVSNATNNPAATYTYNAANQLVASNLAANPPNTAATVNYGYNGDGLRTSKTKNNATEQYIWDTNTSIPKLLEDKNNIYIYGSDSSPVAQISKTTNTASYFQKDTLGSIRSVTNSAGAVTEKRKYDEYGNLTSGTQTVTKFSFAGEYFDEDLGFLYLRARWYDPQTTQFTSVDPKLAATHEAYNYTAGNPLLYTDPLGLSWQFDLLQNATNLAAGFGDAATSIFGVFSWLNEGGFNNSKTLKEYSITAMIRELNGTDSAVQTCSSFYDSGFEVGSVIAVPGGIGKTAALKGFKLAEGLPDIAKVRVGRWMSETEYDYMIRTNRVMEGGGGVTRVSYPASPKGYSNPSKHERYVEFDVPTDTLTRAGSDNWYKMDGPNSLWARAGKGLKEFPFAENIEWIKNVMLK